ncbi:MAG: hypothetical protein U0Y82_16895 [Thermoleophilia bacterium]
MRAVVRNAGRTPVGIVIHGRLLWHDRPVSADVTARFVQCAAESGVRRIRGLDPLNRADHLLTAAEAAQKARITFIPTIVAGPAPALEDAVWAAEARALGQLPGAAAICVSDGGGHLSPTQLATLVRLVAASSGLPVEILVQAPGGIAPLLAKAGVEAGASAVYAAAGPVASPRPARRPRRCAPPSWAAPPSCRWTVTACTPPRAASRPCWPATGSPWPPATCTAPPCRCHPTWRRPS